MELLTPGPSMSTFIQCPSSTPADSAKFLPLDPRNSGNLVEITKPLNRKILNHI